MLSDHLYGASSYMEQTPASVPKTNLEITADPTICKIVLNEMVTALNAGPRSRQRSLAITKLEEASMWLDEALRVE